MKKIFYMLMILLLAACGGGGGGDGGDGTSTNGGNASSTPAVNTVSGVSSQGDPLAGAVIQIWGANGQALANTVADSKGAFTLPAGTYQAPLLLKASAPDKSVTPRYAISFDSATATTGIRANINPVTDVLVNILLLAVNKNQGAEIETFFAEAAPLLTAQAYATAKDKLNQILAPVANLIKQNDNALNNALAGGRSVTELLCTGAMDGLLHTGLDNFLDHIKLQKDLNKSQVALTFPAAPNQAPILLTTHGLGASNTSLLSQINTAMADATTAALLKAPPPALVLNSLSAFGKKASNWSGYTSSMVLWTPKTITGGWTLSFQSKALASQIDKGLSFWNVSFTLDKASNTFTFSNLTSNASLAVDQALAIGFSANGSLDMQVDITNCRLKGQACAIVAATETDSPPTLKALLENFNYNTTRRTTVQNNVTSNLSVGEQNALNGGTQSNNRNTGDSSGGTGGSAGGSTGGSTGSGTGTPAPTTPITLTFSIPSPIWSTGYSGTLTLKNTSSAAFESGANGWRAQIKFPDKATAQDVFQSGPWNFDLAIAADGTVTLTPKTWAATLPVLGTSESGFNGGAPANLLLAKPVDPKLVTIVFDSSVTTPPTQGPTDPGGNGGATGGALTVPPIPDAASFPLTVKGWGNNLEMGTVMIPEAAKDQQLSNSGLKALFKYAGDGGDGDPGAIYFGTKWGNAFYPDATKNSLEMAKRASAKSITSGPLTTVRQDIVPVMVVYTAQLSGGPEAVKQDILDIPAGASAGDNEFLKDHYANLIIETALMMGYKSASNPNPGSILLNPDMLGAMQQGGVINSTFKNKDGTWVKVNVRAKLQAAIDYVYQTQATAQGKGYNLVLPTNKPSLPNDLTDDIKGWFQSQNWVIKTFGQNAISYGWQINLWAPGSSVWVHGVNGDKTKPHTDTTLWRDAAGQVAAFLDYVGVYQGNYVPDYIAFDRYEFDDFREAARNINYAYDAQDWQNFLTFTRQVSSYVKRPAMLWQIPASHLLTTHEAVPNADYVSLHSGTGGSFFMGDPLLGVGAVNAAPSMTSITLNGTPWFGGKTNVGDWLRLLPNYDWTQNQLQLAINSNVFSILWGGGNTMGVIETAATGNDGGWMMARVQNYYKNGAKPLVRK